RKWLEYVEDGAKALRAEETTSKVPWRRHAAADVVRLLVLGAVLELGRWSLYSKAATGRWAIGLSVGYMILLLVTAAFSSSTAYKLPKQLVFIFDFLIMPTRIAALLVVPLLFGAMLYGFAGLYLQAGASFPNDVPVDTVDKALFFSFGGFANYATAYSADISAL